MGSFRPKKDSIGLCLCDERILFGSEFHIERGYINTKDARLIMYTCCKSAFLLMIPNNM